MPTHKQTTIKPAENQTLAGSKSDQAAMKSLFASSPIHSGDLTEEKLLQMAQALLLDGVVNDAGHTFGEFNRDYSGAPNLADVETGEGGLPATPYVPNPSSPSEPGMNPTTIPAAPDGYMADVEPKTWGTGAGSKLSPHDSSAQISGQKIGDLKLNRSS
jgi:hypothetical protein